MDENSFRETEKILDLKFWIQTVSGVQFDLLDPKPEMVKTYDMAHSLARLCRYTGHVAVDGVYSVAEHSVRVYALVQHWLETADATMLDEILKDVPGVGVDGTPLGRDGVVLRLALLHDGHEYVLGDKSAPQKRVLRHMAEQLGIPDVYAMLESKHDVNVRRSYGLPTGALPAIVKRADMALLGGEAFTVLDPRQSERLWTAWRVGNLKEIAATVPEHIKPTQSMPWSCSEAFGRFLGLCDELDLVSQGDGTL